MARCTVKELVDDVWGSIEGNAKLDVTMTDFNPAYSSINDTLSIIVYKSNGGLWYSSNWNGVYTTEQDVSPDFFGAEVPGPDQLIVQ